MDFTEKKAKMVLDIDNYLKEQLKSQFPEIIYEAMSYSLFAGGKRLRSMMLLGTCETFLGDYEIAIPYAAAMECIHTYSLIHDDLPSMDDDSVRRGMPSSHVKFGENVAILAGDALLNLAYEIMINDCANTEGLETRQKLRAMKAIANASGSQGLVGGQVAEMTSRDEEMEIETLLYIHNHKTASLVQAALMAGGELGGARRNYIDQLNIIGSYIGLAYQIKDDILDVISTEQELGKPVGSDKKKNLETYTAIYGLETSQNHYRELSNKALEIVNSLPSKTDFMTNLITEINNREK